MKAKIKAATWFGLGMTLLAFQPIARADESVAIAVGKAKFNPLLQFYVIDDTNPAASTGVVNFRIRRAEFKFSGNANEQFRWWVMVDAAKSPSALADNKILQDLAVAYSPLEGLEFWAGQFKIQTTDDSLEPSGTVMMTDRSVMTRDLFGDKRQTGFLAQYKNSAFKLSAMVSNGGTFANITDTTTAKDLSARLELTMIDPLTFGGWMWSPDMDFANNLKYGAFAKFNSEHLFTRAEFGQSVLSGATTAGWYAELGYKVTETLQPMARFDMVLPPTGFESGYVATLGMNWLALKNNIRLQAAFSALNNANGLLGSPRIATTLAAGATHPTASMLTLAAVLAL